MINHGGILQSIRNIDTNLAQRFEEEISLLKSKGSALVALSGGVDSSIAALAAVLALKKKAYAITFNSILAPPNEIIDAKQVAQEIGIQHTIVPLDIMKNEDITKNNMDRCYFCKLYLIKELEKYQLQYGLNCIIEGSNLTDLDDYRPGLKALKQHGITSPHIEVGLTKQMIRKIARIIDLSVAEKPSASCLATRIPYGDPLEIPRLQRIAQAEEILRSIIPRGQIRVRDHEEIARIELSNEALAILLEGENRSQVQKLLSKLGYRYVTLDLQGYGGGVFANP